MRAFENGDPSGFQRREWTLIDIFAIMRRRRAWIGWTITAMLVLVSIYCILATRRFMASAQIEVQKESPGVFGLDTSVTGDMPTAEDSLDYSVTLETQANILRSDTLALNVIREMKLEPTADYFPQRAAGPGLPGWLFFWRKPVEPLNVPLEEAPNRRYVALKIFASHLKVAPVAGTRLIDVSYSNPDPALAASVVNCLIQSLMDYSFQARYRATAQASTWLGSQLVELKKQTDDLESKAVRMERDTGMYGADGSHNVMLSRLETLNETLASAESNRILKEAIYRISQSEDPELISGLAGNAGASPSTNSLALLQTLRSQEAPLRAELAEDETRYGPAYPKIAELHAQLDGVEKSIQDETHRVGERSRTDYEIAASAEEAARDALDKQKAAAEASNDRATAYVLAKQEADGSRSIYEGLLGRLKQAGILEGLRATNMTVVNQGRMPPPDHPRSPNIPLYYAAALAGGLLMGSSLALLRELQDQRVQSLEELEGLLGSPLLGVVPSLEFNRRSLARLGKRRELMPRLALPESPQYNAASFVEAVCSLRTSVLQQEGGNPQTLLITSSITGEGKSRMAVNLAGALTQLGKKVLLVDADLRRPSLSREFYESQGSGLAGALSGDVPQIRRHPEMPGLSLLCGDEIPSRPSELLASATMARLLSYWRVEYDFIVLDSPPVLPVTDARILSRLCDVTLLVVRHGYASKQSVQRSHRMIAANLPGTSKLGTVLNGVSADSDEYCAYYGYKRGMKPREGSYANA